MKSRYSLLNVVLLFSLMTFLSACSSKDVKPWEKEKLSKGTMKLGGPNNLLNKYEEHIYYSKEGSKGGNGLAGGGCGCN